jgi:hypothetical protein
MHQFDRFQASLSQNNNEKIRSFGTFANENNACIVERYEASGPQITALEGCVSIPEIPNYSFFSQRDAAKLCIDCRRCILFFLGKHSRHIMLYFFVIIFTSIGYTADEPLHEAAKKGLQPLTLTCPP